MSGPDQAKRLGRPVGLRRGRTYARRPLSIDALWVGAVIAVRGSAPFAQPLRMAPQHLCDLTTMG